MYHTPRLQCSLALISRLLAVSVCSSRSLPTRHSHTRSERGIIKGVWEHRQCSLTLSRSLSRPPWWWSSCCETRVRTRTKGLTVHRSGVFAVWPTVENVLPSESKQSAGNEMLGAEGVVVMSRHCTACGLTLRDPRSLPAERIKLGAVVSPSTAALGGGGG